MQEVKDIKIDLLHRGIVIILRTKEGEIYSFKFSMRDARELAARIMRVLGAKRGEGERHAAQGPLKED